MSVTVLFALLFLCKCSGVTHWRIQEEMIKAVNVHTVITPHEICSGCKKDETNEVTVYDKELSIIIKSVHASKQAPWVPPVNHVSTVGSECPPTSDASLRLKITDPKNPSNNRCHVVRKKAVLPEIKMERTTLSCGEPVEFTAYDFLKGVAQRKQLPSHSEPEVAAVFRTCETDTTIDMLQVEALLKSALEKLPLSPELLGQIADYWRIRGETLKAIECFRTALYINPDHSEILLNLARLLYNHQHFEDVIFLTRKSLHLSEDLSSSWKQYYILAETYRQLKKYDDSAGFYRKTLEINPGLHNAEVHLREIGRDGGSVTNTYTAVIITALVSVVLAIIYFLTCNPRHTSNNNNNNNV